MGTGENAGSSSKPNTDGVRHRRVSRELHCVRTFANLSEFGGVCRQWEERFRKEKFSEEKKSSGARNGGLEKGKRGGEVEELGLVGVWRGQGEEEVWEKKKEGSSQK